MNIEKQLEWIDKEYLSHFEKKHFNLDILLEKDFSKMALLEDTFSVNTKEEEKRNTFLFLQYSCGKINKSCVNICT